MKVEIWISHLEENPEKADQYFKLNYFNDWQIELIEFERAGVSGGIFVSKMEFTKQSATQLMLALQKTLF